MLNWTSLSTTMDAKDRKAEAAELLAKENQNNISNYKFLKKSCRNKKRKKYMSLRRTSYTSLI